MAFEALGYYHRYISHEETGEVLRIRIRRFRSLGCEATVSCLPDFCQPYRIVCNAGIADYFAGDGKARRVIGWRDVLGSYRRRWACWIEGKVAGMGPGLLARMGARRVWKMVWPVSPDGSWVSRNSSRFTTNGT